MSQIVGRICRRPCPDTLGCPGPPSGTADNFFIADEKWVPPHFGLGPLLRLVSATSKVFGAFGITNLKLYLKITI